MEADVRKGTWSHKNTTWCGMRLGQLWHTVTHTHTLCNKRLADVKWIYLSLSLLFHLCLLLLIQILLLHHVKCRTPQKALPHSQKPCHELYLYIPTNKQSTPACAMQPHKHCKYFVVCRGYACFIIPQKFLNSFTLMLIYKAWCCHSTRSIHYKLRWARRHILCQDAKIKKSFTVNLSSPTCCFNA